MKPFGYFILYQQSYFNDLNILFLSQFFSTTRGGGEYVVSLIVRKLAENNHRVFVITNKVMGEDYYQHKNIKFIFVPPTLEYKGGLPPGFLDNIRYSFNAIKEGLKVIKNEKIDLIHSNNFSPALSGSILSSLTSRPHITMIHDIFSLCGKNYWKKWGEQSDISRLNVLLAPLFEKLMIKFHYDVIHTVSKTTRDDLINFGAKKPIYIIHNSIDHLINHIQTKFDPYQFTYVGRLVFYKNLEIVIRAINIVKKTEPMVKLVIVGSGPQRESLEELVSYLDLKSNIKFAGYVTKEEKMQIISESNALVFPSLCEGFGLVILEAFSQERPVLVSNIRPMSDIVTHGKDGYVLDPHDEYIWAEHLLKIIKNPSESTIMGKNGSELLSESYDQESMYHKVISMYNDVLKNNSRRY